MSSVKKFLKANLFYILAAVPFVMMDIFIRILCVEVNYSRGEAIAPSILFSVIWIGLIVVICTTLPRLAGRIVYSITFLLFFALFLTNSIYFSYTDFFFSFKLLSLADEGSAYIWNTIAGAGPWIYIFGILVIAAAVIAVIKLPPKKKWNYRVFLISVLIFVLAHTLIPMLYGKANDAYKWDTWRNPRNVYANFNDSNKNIKICGLYEFCFRDFHKSFFSSESTMTHEEEKTLNEFFADPTIHEKNSYTGIFEGKNVIFLQLEGIDSWLLTEKDMPNLYRLQQESVNFTRHYSYYTGGGSTFNSEMAVNTGFITPVTYFNNAYNFTSNLYSDSLPKIFKAEGYDVNAFHMNTGEYYTRKLNYVNWGYDNYYGLLDVTEYADKSYELDRELILNETFHDAMFENEGPFLHYIITYTPHTPFSVDDYRGKVLAKERYGEDVPELTEEDCARMFASETDNMVGLLVQELEEHDLIENTVIVAFSDHYLYTLNDKSILSDNGKIIDNHLINDTPFFIWSQGMEWNEDNTAITVDKVNSQIDILPTTLNMFGIEYTDERYVGRDIMSQDYNGYVFFSDYSWYDGNLYVENNEVVLGEAADSDYVDEMSRLVSSMIQKNDLVQKYDYLRKLK